MSDRQPRRSVNADPVIAELQRDVQHLSDRVPVVEHVQVRLRTDGSGDLRETQIKLHEIDRRPLSVVVGNIQIENDLTTVPEPTAPVWGYDGQLVLRGIGGLAADTDYLITLRVEGQQNA